MNQRTSRIGIAASARRTALAMLALLLAFATAAQVLAQELDTIEPGKLIELLRGYPVIDELLEHVAVGLGEFMGNFLAVDNRLLPAAVIVPDEQALGRLIRGAVFLDCSFGSLAGFFRPVAQDLINTLVG